MTGAATMNGAKSAHLAAAAHGSALNDDDMLSETRSCISDNSSNQSLPGQKQMPLSVDDDEPSSAEAATAEDESMAASEPQQQPQLAPAQRLKSKHQLDYRFAARIEEEPKNKIYCVAWCDNAGPQVQ